MTVVTRCVYKIVSTPSISMSQKDWMAFQLTNCQVVSVYSAAGSKVYAMPEALSPGAGTLSALITE